MSIQIDMSKLYLKEQIPKIFEAIENIFFNYFLRYITTCDSFAFPRVAEWYFVDIVNFRLHESIETISFLIEKSRTSFEIQTSVMRKCLSRNLTDYFFHALRISSSYFI